MDFFVIMIIVIAIFMIVSRVLRGDAKPPSDRPSPTGKTRKDSWPEPRRAAAGRSTTGSATPGRPRSPRLTEPEKRSDGETGETLSSSKSGEAGRGPADRGPVVPTSRFPGLQDDATERAELQQDLREVSRGDDEEQVEATGGYASHEDPALSATPSRGGLTSETVEEGHAAEPSPGSPPGADPEAAPSQESPSLSQSQPEPEPEPELGSSPAAEVLAGPERTPTLGATGTTGPDAGTTGLDVGTTPAGGGSSSSGYSYSSIGSVYTSTSVYTSSSTLGQEAPALGQASPEPAAERDSSEADGESDGAGEETRSAGS